MRAKTTRRALFMSVLSLLLCVSMLVGTTFAWFTDEVTSGKNQIVAGNLDVELKYGKVVDGQVTAFDSVQGKDDLFDKNTLWEPGHVEVVYLEVSNQGSLALKYQLGVNVYKETIGKTKDDADIKLSDHLVFKTVLLDDASQIGKFNNRELAKETAGTEKGLKDYNGELTPLEVGRAHYVALIVYMPESVDNKANHDGEKVPFIEMGVNLFATQYTSEEDSFGANYDEAARYSAISLPGTLPETGSTEPTEDMLLKTMDGVSTMIPADLVENIDDKYANAQHLHLKHTEPIFDDAAKTVSFGNIDIVDENGNVIDLEAMNNTVPITVVVPVGDTFAVGETVIIYHDGEPVASAVVDADKNVTYTVVHFCEVVVSAGDGKIDSAVELAAAIAGGGTIMLEDDLVLTNQILIPAGTAVTLDLNGKTITSTMTSGRAIVTQGTLTLKNGTIVTNNGVNGVYATGSTAGLTLTDMVINVNGTGTNAEWNHAAIGAANGASVTVNNGTYSAEVGYGLCVMTSGAHIIINDGTFTTGGTINSAAVRLDSGWGSDKIYTAAVINGGTFNAPEGGWAFTANNAYGKDITINGGIFNGELDSAYQDNGVVINGGTFNKTIFQGGGHQDKYLIKGGTFAENVSAKVAEEYVTINNGDGTFTVRPDKTSVATVAELNEALAQGGKIALTADITTTETIAVSQDVEVILDLGGHTLAGQVDKLLELKDGDVTIQNGTIRNVHEAATDTKYSIYMSGDAKAVIKNVTIETTGIGVYMTDDAHITELNANISSYVTVSGYCAFDAVSLEGNARVDAITGGTYKAYYTEEFVALKPAGFNTNYVSSFALRLNSTGASVGTISGGTFLSTADSGNMGAALYVNNGTVECISGGYFGYMPMNLNNVNNSIYVNLNNGGKINAITGGTFEKGAWNTGFRWDFEGLVNTSGCKVVDTGETAQIQVQLSTRVDTYNLAILEVVVQ